MHFLVGLALGVTIGSTITVAVCVAAIGPTVKDIVRGFYSKWL
jgi:hypothetical protein